VECCKLVNSNTCEGDCNELFIIINNVGTIAAAKQSDSDSESSLHEQVTVSDDNDDHEDDYWAICVVPDECLIGVPCGLSR
jgi:hypothetical protein